MIKTKIQVTGPDMTEWLMSLNDYYQVSYDWAKEFVDKNLVLNVCHITIDSQSVTYDFCSVNAQRAAEWLVHWNDTYPSYPGHTKVIADRLGYTLQIVSQEEFDFDSVEWNCSIVSETDLGQPVFLDQPRPVTTP